MEAKKDLNNQQRKMLDEIYTEQFKKKEQRILEDRREGYQDLHKKVLKKERSSKNVKAVMDAATKFRELVLKHKEEFDEKGLTIDHYYRDDKFDLKISDSYRSQTHPDLKAYQEETYVIEENLAKVKKEMRARIYGLNTTYEEVDKEIAEILKGLKV